MVWIRVSELLFGLIFSHFIADYLLQTDKINAWKNSQDKNERWKGLIWHSTHHFICYILVYLAIFLFYKNWSFYILLTPLIISVIHFVVDFIKVQFLREKSSTLINAITYVADQFIHLVVIYLVLQFITQEINYTAESVVNFLKSLLSNGYNHVLFSLKDKAFLLGSLTIITTHFYGYLIGIMLKPFILTGSFQDTKIESKAVLKTDTGANNKIKQDESYIVERTDTITIFEDDPNRIGIYIGMVERLIIVILVITKSVSAIGFLIALKALTRFKQFDNKNFAEYYLIGNLLSILLGFIISFFALRILAL